MATYYMRADGTAAFKTITGCADNGSGLIRVTSAGHGLTDGMEIAIGGVVGTTEANGNWVVCNDETDTFDLTGSTFANAYTSGGKAIRSDPDAAASAMSVATHNAGTFSAGDVIYLSSQGGDFTTIIVVPSSGSDGNPIIYTNVAGEDVTIKLALTDLGSTGWTETGAGTHIYTKVATAYESVFIDYLPMSYKGSTSLTSNTWYQTGGTVYIRCSDDSDPNGKSVRTFDSSSSNSIYCAFKFVDRSYLTFQKNTTGSITIRNAKRVLTAFYGMTTSSVGITIDGLVAYHCEDFVLIYIGAAGLTASGTIKNCQAYYCCAFSRMGAQKYDGTEYTSTHTWDIHDNYGEYIGVVDSNNLIWHSSFDAEVFGFQNAQDCNIYNNEFYEGNAIAVFFYVNTSAETCNNNAYNNIFINHRRKFLYFCCTNGTNGKINNNKIYNNISYNTSTEVVYNALCYNIHIPKYDLASSVTNYVMNNTVYGLENGIVLESADTGCDFVFKNNIIRGMGFKNVWVKYASSSGYTIDYNNFEDDVTFIEGGGSKSWATWNSTHTHDISSDPLLINGSGSYNTANDFKLQSTSPAKGAGADVDVDTDYNGFTHVPTTAPSIGAHSFGHTQRVRHYRR